jgi:hypothetical protein
VARSITGHIHNSIEFSFARDNNDNRAEVVKKNIQLRFFE